ncbi:MAG TPA: lysophospholipid acyltransferase family protein [Solirubrobacterales bacterium]|nr:lysophospholipid acyltransferase family protein [Solirubrobacterales bacterium]
MPEIKPQVYKDPRPAEYFDRFHDWARSHGAGWTYDAARMLVTPLCLLVYRCRAIGTENVPASGPVIFAPNHFSNLDHFFAGVFLRRKVRFMAKSQLFGRSRVLTYIFRVGGAFPVRRGHGDNEAFKTSHAILARGDTMLIYAEGGRSRTGKLGKPRPGVGRVALESGAPVVPVAIHGSLGVRGWRRLKFPKITVQYGEPLAFDVVERPSREQQQEAAERIFGRVREMYAELDARGRADVIRSRRASGAGRPGDEDSAQVGSTERAA